MQKIIQKTLTNVLCNKLKNKLQLLTSPVRQLQSNATMHKVGWLWSKGASYGRSPSRCHQ